ncbi:cytochrome b/b6 domain-containing protein [Vibrio scophthalmi]|uniref:cytochrome b/b6 domain-containing protein n=1 Tax=Vibrio scophthalmi TaxID=45658 RepID=UPI00228499CA|nr:cytochrome b/b6 domain-containing protein [Vibrio scophthalmi]MCY9802576.1 cytochrome b/b6 domain-containing protein [Vibrio scophthalmi]
MALSRVKEGVDELFADLPKSEKVLHALILVWILAQIITSNFMHVHADTLWGNINLTAKLHAYGGLCLLPITLVFVYRVIKRRTIADMYPWLSGNINQIKQDIKVISTLRLPESQPAGLAATVEGLGLLALVLALLTGAIWYLVASNSGTAPQLLEIHKTSVGLIETYFYAHGGMALLHYIHWWRNKE